jgi:ElaB/YqjD/DUF883 family membrane-anchored ribosome-binding protein
MAEQATSVADLPLTQALIESLIADYEGGRLPADAMARVDELRNEFYERTSQQFGESGDQIKGDLAEFSQQLLAQIESAEAQNGPAAARVTDEYVDSDLAAVAVTAQDGLLSHAVEPIFEAAIDMTRDALDVAHDLAELRFAHDLEGSFAAQRTQFEAEFSSFTEQLDASVDSARDRFDGAHDSADATLNAYDAEQGVTRIPKSTSIDPHLNDQIDFETGQVAT